MMHLLTVWFWAFQSPQVAMSNTGDWLQYARAEDAGFSSAALEEIFVTAEQGRTAALLVVYRGRVLVSWGFVESRYKCHSVRKSFLNGLIGMYVNEGKIDLDATLADLGIDDLGGLSESEKQATVRDLIRSRSGVYHPAAKEPRSMKSSRPQRGTHPPGSHFWYNNWDFNTLASILEQRAQVNYFEAFRDRIATPLGMQDFRMRDGFVEFDRSASLYPAHAIRLSARDMARYGQLYLQGGRWQGQQLIPKSWVEESTRVHSQSEHAGYGYLWWVLEKGSFPKFSEMSAYLASGVGGQSILVCPDSDMVVVHRGDTDHNRHARFSDAMQLFEMIWAARTGEPVENPRLEPLHSRPLEGRLEALPDRDFVTLEASQLERLAGRYALSEEVVVGVRAMADRLVIVHPQRGEMDLFPTSATDFYSWNSNIEAHFQAGDGDQISGVNVSVYGQPMTARRVD